MIACFAARIIMTKQLKLDVAALRLAILEFAFLTMPPASWPLDDAAPIEPRFTDACAWTDVLLPDDAELAAAAEL